MQDSLFLSSEKGHLVLSILSAKQNGYLTTIANEPTQAAASGSSFVFTIGLVLAVINVVLSLFIKKPK